MFAIIIVVIIVVSDVDDIAAVVLYRIQYRWRSSSICHVFNMPCAVVGFERSGGAIHILNRTQNCGLGNYHNSVYGFFDGGGGFSVVARGVQT